MKKYKIKIVKEYVIDVEDTKEERAIQIAKSVLDTKMRIGEDHYYETETPEITVYDVTHTDDPFNAEN